MKQINRLEMERANKNAKKVFGTLLVTIVLISLGMLLFSCTPSESSTSADTTNCNCGVVVQSMSFNIPDNNGGVIVQSTIIVRNNCTQLTKTVSGISGTVATGAQWCQ
jgi:hypothetical protein